MTPTVDREQVVQQYWPYDGPHDENSITSAAQAVAELVRYLSNATRTTIPASEMYDVLGSLYLDVGGLLQLTRQLAATADRYSQDGTLRHDEDRDDPETARKAAQQAARTLRTSGSPLAGAATVLDRARQLIGHLYHDTNQPERR